MSDDIKKALSICAVVFSVLLLARTLTATPNTDGVSAGAVEENGVQIVRLVANRGYSPALTRAKANTPTELHVETNGTFDCSATLVIPRLNYQQILPSTGTTIVPISADKATGTLDGQCAMGMYRFSVVFE